MNVIIFSKNRAAQLELLIRSMKKFFMEFFDLNIKILYKYTNSDFLKGYEKLKIIHNDKNITWKIETDFKKDLLELFDIKEKYTVFFVDDIIFKESFTLNSEQFKIFEKRNDILSLSLRIHPRLDYSYPPNVHMRPPNFDDNLVYNWIGQDACYGYPMSLDGNIFRTIDILYHLTSLQYNNPNSLESIMDINPLLSKPYLICFERSIILNNPCNKVQDFNNNRKGDINVDFLNNNFLNNKIIDLNKFIGIDNKSCHVLMDINFI